MGLFNSFRKKVRPRAVVVGLDGVPYTLLQNLKDKGNIPHMASIFEEGYFGQMSVSIPEISSVSWSSFMTGSQPGKHGIYGFMDLEPGTYKMYFPNFNSLKVPTLWDDLATLSKKSVVLNMPATYPARKIEGVLVSGFVAIDINKAVYPSELVPRLNEIGYRIDVDITKSRKDHEFLFQDLYSTLDAREHTVDFLWREVDWDLFIVVITGTDRLMHFLWEAYENERHPYHGDFQNYFRKVDSFVAGVYDRFLDLDGCRENNNQFYMLSDHGFTGIKSEVYLNRWLQENGYLHFQREQPESIMDIGIGSTAFALDPSRIYLNLKRKYPLGAIDSADYDRVIREIKEGLEALTFESGKRVVKKAYVRDELYQGPTVDRGPDLVLLSNPGYDLKGKVNSGSIFARSDLSGMHSQDDAFFFSTGGGHCTSICAVKGIISKPFFQDRMVPG